jgi:two-component system sensor histidine kinase and response regulator WspE
LLGLAGESLVESRWLRPYSDSMQRLKRLHAELAQSLDGLHGALPQGTALEQAEDCLAACTRKTIECQQFLAEKLQELDLFDRRTTHLSHRLYLEVLRARMRPFGDSTRRFQRMVRDLARALGKEARLEILGETTQIDRDLLERLETPLAHLLRNAVDHGCETPAERERAGKPREGLIRLEARHNAGLLLMTVSDDGPGIGLEKLRRTIVERRLAPAGAVERFTESELLEYLFLPGVTLKDNVTEISGRGVGLDVVQNIVRGVRGTVRVANSPGRGVRFQLQLPLTLSVLRALLVAVAGEPYAIPLARISRTLKIPRETIQTVERRRYFALGSQQVALTPAHQLLDCEETQLPENDLPVVVLDDRNTRHGLIVDRFLGERELVVQPLDPRLGKVKDICAAALMEDGSPVLILDVEDVINSINSGLAM